MGNFHEAAGNPAPIVQAHLTADPRTLEKVLFRYAGMSARANRISIPARWSRLSALPGLRAGLRSGGSGFGSGLRRRGRRAEAEEASLKAAFSACHAQLNPRFACAKNHAEGS